MQFGITLVDVRFARCRFPGPRGFTLLELMIVIAIIGALVSILLPVILSARASARRVVCLSNLSQIGKTLRIYASDFDGWIPRKCAASPKSRAQFPPWVIAFDYELNRLELDQIALAAHKFKVLRCPSAPQFAFATRPGDYLVNALVVGSENGYGSGRVCMSGLSKIHWVRNPAQVVFFADMSLVAPWWTDDPTAWPLITRQGDLMVPGAYLALMDLWHPIVLPTYRPPHLVPRLSEHAHGRNLLNALYFDGSVRTVNSMELRVRDFDDGFRGKRPHSYTFEDIWGSVGE